MNDLVVQFARLWGQYEGCRYTAKDEDVSDMLKAYDSLELYGMLYDWAEEYCFIDAEDTVDFFEKKIEEMSRAEKENNYDSNN